MKQSESPDAAQIEMPIRLRRRIFALHILAALGLIMPFALFQFFVVMSMTLEGFNPRLLLVPLVVGTLFGFLLAKIRILQQEFSHLNQRLEERVEERTLRLAQSQHFTQQILDTQTNVVLLSDINRLLRVNQAFFRLLPQFKSLDEFLARHQCICELFERGTGNQFIGKEIEGEIWIRHIDEHPEASFRAQISGIIFDLRVRHLDTDEGRLYVVNMSDMTEMVRTKISLEETGCELRRELFTDHLTGLPNRRSLLADLQDPSHTALLLLDIDSFKEINDFFGHHSGDDILAAVGERLLPLICGYDGHLYRLAGDEFCVLLEIDDEAELACTTEQILALIDSAAFSDRNGSEISVSITIGAVLLRQSGSHRPLAAAAVALKGAKSQQRPWLLHSEAIDQHAIYALNLAQARLVRYAIANNRVLPFYQPILNLRSKEIEKYEVLARIIDEQDELVLPKDFLSAAKASKYYPDITRRIFEQALTTLARMPGQCQFSFNLSIEDILNRDSAEFIIQRIAESGLGRQCVLEILESEGLYNFDRVNAFIHRARELGCQLAIDDFGAGFSNFEYLLKLEVDYLKIDASLVRELGHDDNALIIVRTIQEFASQLGMSTVAEHVHNSEVMGIVERLGIDYAQGFHIAHPGEAPLPPKVH